MAQEITPRRAFILRHTDGLVSEQLAGYIFDAMQMASTHDPDHGEKLKELERRIEKLEHPNVSRREHR